jgi:Mor family transcriptional regulator
MSTDMVETNADIRRHELLADVAEQTAKRLIEKHALPEDMAFDVGNDLADFFSAHWNGQNVYMVADSQFKLSKRDLEIFRRMERGNAHELAREFGISYVRVYQIYKRCLSAARARHQPSLFESPVAELSTGTGQEPLD